MKPFLLFLFLLPPLLFGSTAPDVRPLKVLFIGNSYTAWHSLPEIVAQMAHSKGHRLYYEMHTPGGRSFQRHWNEEVVQGMIAAKRWDFVVFQNQSFQPVHDPVSMLTYGKKLAALVHENGSQPVYFITWAYARERDFMKENPAFRGLFPEMQARLNDAYRTLAEENGGLLCPVGPAWERFRERYPETVLHHSDASHAAPPGAYLSALMLYRVLFAEEVSAMPGTVYPYFDGRSIDRWGERLTVDPDLRLAMEAIVNEVASENITVSPR